MLTEIYLIYIFSLKYILFFNATLLDSFLLKHLPLIDAA